MARCKYTRDESSASKHVRRSLTARQLHSTVFEFIAIAQSAQYTSTAHGPLCGETMSSADAVTAARALGLTMEVVHAATPRDIDTAFDSLTERRVGALLLGTDAFYGGRIQQLVSLAARYKMLAMYYHREFAEAGGLASYRASVTDAYSQIGVYVTHVLNGEKPGELPVIQAAKFEFVLNLKTARALGIDVPMAFSAAADEIIE